MHGISPGNSASVLLYLIDVFSTNLASTGGAAVNLPVLPLLVHSSILHAPRLTVSVKIIVTAVTITTSAAASDATAVAVAVAITIATATATAVATAIAAVTAVAAAAAVAVAISSATAVAVSMALAAAAAVAGAAVAVPVPVASPIAFPFATAGTTAMSVTELIQRYPYLFIFFGLKILKLTKYIFQIRKSYYVFILNETSQTTVGHICGEISSWFFCFFCFFFPKGVCHRPQCFLTENPLFVPFALEKILLSEFKFSQLFCDDTE